MNTPPEIPTDEYGNLVCWMKRHALWPTPKRQRLFERAYRYGSQKTGLTLVETKRLVALLDRDGRNDVTRWVEHYCNEYRKHGQPPSDA